MITPLPSVQHDCKDARRIVHYSAAAARADKRAANRRHRRYLERITRTFVHDSERFDDEAFAAPSLSGWDIA